MKVIDEETVVGENGHTYPSKYTPGSHWALDEAWSILDTIKPGVIPTTIRAWLAGQITARLMKERGERSSTA